MITQNTLNRLDGTLRAAAVPIDGVAIVSDGVARVDYQAAATPQQRAQGEAIVAAFDWSAAADATYSARQAKTVAGSTFDAQQSAAAPDRALIALVQLILDEFNAHSALEASLFAAIAAATSLADLKTRAAAVALVPQRTQAQLIAAIKAKITAGAE